MVLKFFFLTAHDLRTVPMHYYCYCAHFLRIPRKKLNAQHAGHTDWFCLLQVWEVLVITCGKEVLFFNR